MGNGLNEEAFENVGLQDRIRLGERFGDTTSYDLERMNPEDAQVAEYVAQQGQIYAENNPNNPFRQRIGEHGVGVGVGSDTLDGYSLGSDAFENIESSIGMSPETGGGNAGDSSNNGFGGYTDPSSQTSQDISEAMSKETVQNQLGLGGFRGLTTAGWASKMGIKNIGDLVKFGAKGLAQGLPMSIAIGMLQQKAIRDHMDYAARQAAEGADLTQQQVEGAEYAGAFSEADDIDAEDAIDPTALSLDEQTVAQASGKAHRSGTTGALGSYLKRAYAALAGEQNGGTPDTLSSRPGQNTVDIGAGPQGFSWGSGGIDGQIYTDQIIGGGFGGLQAGSLNTEDTRNLDPYGDSFGGSNEGGYDPGGLGEGGGIGWG